MNKNIHSICVFASASNVVDKKYYDCAYNLGVHIAKNGYNIVYGASNRGLMGEVTRAAKINGSETIGVMPEMLYNKGVEPGDCSKFILTKGMRERKAKMDELSQATIALPGGFGTIEELSEIIVQKQLGYNNKPIVILNYFGYYNDLIAFFENVIRQNFAHFDARSLYYVTEDTIDAINYINTYEFSNNDYIDKVLQN